MLEIGDLFAQSSDGDGLAFVGDGRNLGKLGGVNALGVNSVQEELDKLVDLLLTLEVEGAQSLVVLVKKLQRFIHN